MDESISELVVGILAEMGLPAPTNAIQTMLMRDGYCVGHKLRYDGGHAVWRAGGNTIDLYDDQGQLLKTVAIGTEKEAA